MIRRQLTFATGVLVVFFCLSGAMAQEDSLLQRYDLAIENLEIATASVPTDGAQARDELERALNALLTLSRDATSTNLVRAMERTFERTRVAVENQSHTDMAVQTAVLAGGFSRLVMDSAYLNASSGDLETARNRLLHLAERLDFTADDVAALTAADAGPALRFAFEAGAADAITTELASAQDLMASDQDAAYVSLAKAYGESLLVQDSPRIDASLNRDLVGAAQAVVNEDAAALDAAAKSATLTLTSLANAARAGSEGTLAPGGAQQAPAPESLPELATAPTPATTDEATTAEADTAAMAEAPQAAEAAEAAETPAPGAVDQDAEAGGPAQASVAEEAAAAVPEATLEAAVAARLAQQEAEARQLKVDAITRRLASAGLGPSVAATNAERLVSAGFDDLDDVFNGLQAATARVVAGVRRGDQAAARAALAQVDASYRRDLAPALAQLDPTVDQATSDLLTNLANRTHLTLAEAGLLSARLDVALGAFEGAVPALGDDVEASVDAVWSDMTRSAVFVILGILAIFPLVLLNMAFGGGNRNWRLVGWALFLLLVPVFYQAVAGLFDLLGRVIDVSWFPDLERWSMFDSVTGQAAWALLVFIALILAIIGLRGICVQFGLLGASKKSAVAKQTATAAKSGTGHTTIDWDEEF